MTFFKKDKVTDEKTQENKKRNSFLSFFKHDKAEPHLPKGFANDATRTTSRPDTLYGFDDPTARKLGPMETQDPTNTGA